MRSQTFFSSNPLDKQPNQSERLIDITNDYYKHLVNEFINHSNFKFPGWHEDFYEKFGKELTKNHVERIACQLHKGLTKDLSDKTLEPFNDHNYGVVFEKHIKDVLKDSTHNIQQLMNVLIGADSYLSIGFDTYLDISPKKDSLKPLFNKLKELAPLQLKALKHKEELDVTKLPNEENLKRQEKFIADFKTTFEEVKDKINIHRHPSWDTFCTVVSCILLPIAVFRSIYNRVANHTWDFRKSDGEIATDRMKQALTLAEVEDKHSSSPPAPLRK